MDLDDFGYLVFWLLIVGGFIALVALSPPAPGYKQNWKRSCYAAHGIVDDPVGSAPVCYVDGKPVSQWDSQEKPLVTVDSTPSSR